MLSVENYGQLVRYWSNGWRIGILLRIEKNTAIIKNPVPKKRDKKVLLSDCQEYQQERKTMSVFSQLFNAAETVGMKEQIVGQPDNDYLILLVRAISKLPVEIWDGLPIPAQAWFNEAAPYASKMQILPPCPGYVGLGEVEKVSNITIPAKGLTATEVFSSPASRFQASTPETPPLPKKRKSTGIMDAVRRTVVIHPEWTSRQVYDYLKLNGYPDAKLDTISVDGGNIRRVIELAKELGFWNDKKEDSVAAAS